MRFLLPLLALACKGPAPVAEDTGPGEEITATPPDGWTFDTRPRPYGKVYQVEEGCVWLGAGYVNTAGQGGWRQAWLPAGEYGAQCWAQSADGFQDCQLVDDVEAALDGLDHEALFWVLEAEDPSGRSGGWWGPIRIGQGCPGGSGHVPDDCAEVIEADFGCRE